MRSIKVSYKGDIMLKEKKQESKHKEEKKSHKEEMFEKIKETKIQEESLIESWKKNKFWTDAINSDAYFEMENYIRMVAGGHSNGAILSGEGGLGKSFNTISILNKENPNYSYTDSYSTPVAFYAWMYKNKNKILVLDDVIGLLEDKRGNAYLKSALWEVNGKRLIHNMSMKPPKDEYDSPIPDHFEFTGGIIILTNKLNTKNAHVAALLTRVNHAIIKISFEEKMRILELISKKPHGKLSGEDRKDIFEFIKENSSESTMEINLRTLIKMYQFFEYSREIKSPKLWKRLGLNLLKKDEKLLLIEELAKKQMPVEEQVSKFKELTNMGRATFFRLKKELEMSKETAKV